MIAAIMQPTYLPWIGYFDLIDSVDCFVFLDDAQVLKRSWGVRNRILSQGRETFLTVPLSGHTHGEGSPFVTTRVDQTQDWARKHLNSVRHAYAKASAFDEVMSDLEDILTAGHETIGALNQAFVTSTARRLGIDTPFQQSSGLPDVQGTKDDWLLSICRSIGADIYLSARGSAGYIEQDQEGGAFAGSGVSLVYHDFSHPEYNQQSDSFVSHLSVIDLLMNHGYADALDIIRSGRRPPLTSAQVRESQE